MLKDRIQKGYEINQLRNNFIVNSPNPLKICVWIINLCNLLKRSYPAAEKAVEYWNEKFSNLVKIIWHSWADIIKISKALEGK